MITKDNNLKVMEFFFKHPYRTFHIRELARLSGLSSTGIIKIVKRLKKEKLLVSQKTKTVEEIKPDFDGRFLLVKRLYNVYALYNSGLIDFIKRYYEQPQGIVLFGSFAEGNDTEKSDIDLAVIADSKNIPDVLRFEKKLVRKVNLHILKIEKAEKEFVNSLANGIVLEGFVDFKW